MFAKNWRNVSSNGPLVIPSNSCTDVLYLGDTKTSERNPNAGMVSLTEPTSFSSKPGKVLHPLMVVYKKFRAVFPGRFCCNKFPTVQIQTVFLTQGRNHWGGTTAQWFLTKNYSQVSYSGRWSSEKKKRNWKSTSRTPLPFTTLQFKSSTQQSWARCWLDKCRVEPLFNRQKAGGRGRRSEWNFVIPKKVFCLIKNLILGLLNHVFRCFLPKCCLQKDAGGTGGTRFFLYTNQVLHQDQNERRRFLNNRSKWFPIATWNSFLAGWVLTGSTTWLMDVYRRLTYIVCNILSLGTCIEVNKWVKFHKQTKLRGA